jgi:uncharacterized membrane protein YuzA (DUF378 family)
MKIVTNEKIIKRNAKIGQYTTLVSLGVLGVGLFLSFNEGTFNYSLIALVVGFVLSQIGIYFGNRWGRPPRVDERLSQSLKGLGDQFTLYHYSSPVSHLLIGPAGVWVLLPYYQRGTMTYDQNKNRWRQKGGNWYLKLFGQEGLGRVDLDVESSVQEVQKFLNNLFENQEPPAVNAAVVFTNDKTDVQAPDAPVPTIESEKLKDLIRRKAKEHSTVDEQMRKIENALPRESISA